MIGTDMFRYLDGPVQRVGSTFTPVGFNPILEKEILPDEAKIYEAAKSYWNINGIKWRYSI